ncbi:FecR domain-containing protein [Mucilaginibacter sp. JRF]|uniref:FecR family protein n=1 Tax=Mucilaginibacter sp. JRF TaxID=2780088 RepID=UPI0018801FAA|nr:FecR domain-containing protein [Mucilaginibacter sp. JRF]MBE9583988.1 FecR domain-containing protein [Mucilaginibacter sp. JRF]
MEKIRKIFKRYLKGKATPAQQQQVDDWYQRLGEQKQVNLTGSDEKLLEEKIWQRIEPQLQPRHQVRSLYFYLKVAASIVVVAGAGLWLGMDKLKPGNASAQLNYQEYVTGIGQRRQLTLGDSSVIILNAASKLRVYDGYDTLRRIDLVEGEAFFDVHHNPKAPFYVHTGNVTTRVLGTAFDIKAYKKLNKLSVSVLRGKVRVYDTEHDLAMLIKQQRVTYNLLTGKSDVQTFGEDVTAWRDGKLLFKDYDFNEVALAMENYYGVKVIAADKRVTKGRYTATMPNALTAEKAAEVLASIHHLKIKHRRDTIEFSR